MAVPAAVSGRWAPAPQTENTYLGSEAAEGDCFEHHSNTSTGLTKKKNELSEVGNALDSEMKMSTYFPRYLARCLFLQILYRKINSSFGAFWDVPINTLSIYRVRSLEFGKEQMLESISGITFLKVVE